MRLLAIFIVFTISVPALIGQSNYYPDEKIISYTANDKPLKRVLIELSLKTDVNISFNEKQIIRYQSISLAERGKSLGSILSKALEFTDLKYKVIDRQIVIIKDIENWNSNDNLITISGYIEDKQSLERLVNANIYLPSYEKGTISNAYGFYSFKIPKGENKILVSYLGYTTLAYDADFQEDTTINFELDLQNSLREVVITDEITTISVVGDSIVENRQERELGMIETLGKEEIKSMVALGGESDIVKLAQFLPGITSGADGFGGLFVRGGTKDQNLVLLDGIPIYNSDHGLGIFSIFNTEVVKNAKLYKSGIPARYEGRLSSVLDIRTKEGNRKETSGNITAGLFTAKASIEGPISKGKSSYLISYRRSIFDPWINALANYIDDGESDAASTSFVFYDFNAKLNFKLSDKHRLYFSIYRGRDKFKRNNETGDVNNLMQTSEYEVDWDWGNDLAVVRLNSQLSNKVFLNTSAYYSIYTFNSFDLDRFQFFDDAGSVVSDEYSFGLFNSDVRDLGAKIDLDIVPNPTHFLKIGLSFINHNFKPGLYFYSSFVSDDFQVEPTQKITKRLVGLEVEEDLIEGNEIQFYVEDEIRFSDNFNINLGIANTLITTNGINYLRPQPRLSLNFDNKSMRLYSSFGMISQFAQALTNSGLGFPADLWLPTTDKLTPQKATYVTAGMGFNLSSKVSMDIEAYYKSLSEIVAFNEGGIFNIGQNTNWEEQIPKGNGKSFGIEFSLKRTVGSTNWFLNYTLSKASRQFETINAGEEFAARYDKPHAVKFAFFHRFSRRFELSINWLFSSGTRITLPTSFIEVPLPDGTVDLRLIYEDKNNYTLPNYHSLDIGFNLYKYHSWGEQKFSFGATNVYNRKNPFYVDLVRDLGDSQTFTVKEFTLFPLMPSLSYSISF